MPTFKACVRGRRSDGFWPVYIRVTHKRSVRYMPTGLSVDSAGLSQSKEITDARVLRQCSERILEYNRSLQSFPLDLMDVSAVVSLLQTLGDDLSFSDYCQGFIDDIINAGRERTARNYKAALKSLRLFFGTQNITFRMMTVNMIRDWVEGLCKCTVRAKEQYPTCIRNVFRHAELRYNDYEREIIRIKYNPFSSIKIPQADTPQKRAVNVKDCRQFFSAVLPESKMAAPLAEIGRDVAFLSFCLVGMNTIDLYNLKKDDYDGETISYCRSKSRRLRHDDAFIRIRIEPFVSETFNKYLSDEGDSFLFNFHKRFCDADSFCSNVNSGIKQVCRSMGRPDLYLCIYSFRHSWATYAQNEFGCSYSEIGFALNHSRHRGVTDRYVAPDFGPVWELNRKVLNFVFFSDSAGHTKSIPRHNFRITERMMITGEAYNNGRCLSRVRDIGFSNVDDVLSRLISGLPDGLPDGLRVYFILRNDDNEETITYMRQKGKGF